MFDAADYQFLHGQVFREDYPGYQPTVVEAPNGDGNWDFEKRYAHIATKYLERVKAGSGIDIYALDDYLTRANGLAVAIAVELGVPRQFWPVKELGALRVLEYSAGADSADHTDFDLFTLMCYRNIPRKFEYTTPLDSHLEKANTLNQQIHFGEILELVCPSMKATGHKVDASQSRSQYSMVFFAIPDHDAVLPSGVTVGDWLKERMSRSRKKVE